jgi:alkylated DNA nucleotide flippase Atl1
MLISSPDEIASVLAKVPPGRVITLGALRAHLAALHDADYTCPLTTGLFLRILAKANADLPKVPKVPSVPWWRVVRDTGALLDKLPGQADHLLEEGVPLMTRGKGRGVAQLDAFAWTPRPRGQRKPQSARHRAAQSMRIAQ